MANKVALKMAAKAKDADIAVTLETLNDNADVKAIVAINSVFEIGDGTYHYVFYHEYTD